MAQDGYPAWVKSPKEVQEHFQVDIATGLSADEVDRRRAEYGHNELTKEPPTPIWKLIMEQFDDTLVKVGMRHPGHARNSCSRTARTAACMRTQRRDTAYAVSCCPPAPDAWTQILLGSALVSFILAYFEEHKEEGIRAYIEPLVIVLILILNAAVGVWQESNAEAALEALKDLQGETARVIRGGKMVRPCMPAWARLMAPRHGYWHDECHAVLQLLYR